MVKFTTPAGFEPSPEDEGNDATDSDADPVTGQTGIVNLTSGEDDTTVDAGVYRPASLGDYVWEDRDADGQQDSNEPGIEGVVVMLLDENGAMLDQTTTNASGFYSFTDLTPGDYIVKFTAPTGYEPTADNQGNDTSDSDADEMTGRSPIVNLASGENDPTIDAGFIPAETCIGDFVWNDLDGDGIQDPGEPGIPGVVVTVYTCATPGETPTPGSGTPEGTDTTDDNGQYEICVPSGDNYYVQVTLPNGSKTTLSDTGNNNNDSDANQSGTTPSMMIPPGTPPIDSIDIGLKFPASIGDYTWLDEDQDGRQDANEEGLEGVQVSLTDENGDPVVDFDGNPVLPVLTDQNGAYTFDNLEPGDYIVVFNAPNANLEPSPANVGNDASDSDANVTTGESPVVNLQSGENDPTIDAGFYGVCEATVVAEPAVICVGSSTVVTANSTSGIAPFTYAWSSGQNTASITVSPVVNTTYTVTITDANNCSATASTSVTVDPAIVSGIDAPTTVCANEGALFIASPAVSGASYSWTFTGPATPSSATGASVTVLWSEVGVYNATLVVERGDCIETYQHVINITEGVFGDAGDDVSVCQGGSVQIGLPEGQSAPSGATYNWSPNLFISNATVAQPFVNPPFDLTYTMTVSLNGCSRTSTVHVDVDVNKNPIADAGDDVEVCPGTLVTLGGNPTATPPPAEPTTGIAGLFWTPATGLSDQFADNPTTVASQTQTYQVIVVATTGCTDTADVTITVLDCASLGDFVWVDSDQDGQQDNGESGISDVTVNLLDGNGNFLETTTTDVNGFYEFTDLASGNYIVGLSSLQDMWLAHKTKVMMLRTAMLTQRQAVQV
ncbi:MAG: SdrD B-like domain-containing protein [Saprospiraceae bacterium]